MGERRARLHEAIARLDLSRDDHLGDAFAELIAGADARRHAHAVAALADRLATALHLDDTSRLDLERAALFHDLGKQAIPPALLDKPAPLTRDEREIVRRLPVEGYEALKDLAPLAGAANLILAMLERPSGLGYPRGLAGRAIPPGASILAVADALDTMTNPRPYRAAVSLAEALAELRRGRGSQFDPDVVDAALSLFAAS
jgi:HD-GYP domain-containing protein (c-di-GMP phosphodiesterase class II)